MNDYNDSKMIWDQKVYKIRNVRGYPVLQIPKSIMALAGFKIGDHVYYSVSKGQITIRKVEWKDEKDIYKDRNDSDRP